MSVSPTVTVVRRLRAYRLVPEDVPVRLVRLGRNAASKADGRVSWRAEDATMPGVRLGVESVHTVEELARARKWARTVAGGVTLIAPCRL